MTLELRDVTFFGPALPEPFVKFQLEGLLLKRGLLPKATGPAGKQLQERWEVYRRKLRALGEQGGLLRVASHVLEPLVERLGYATLRPEDDVETREGLEDAGFLLATEDGASVMRAWATALGTDLDAPNRRGHAYRFSPSRIAQRVLLAKGERVGLLTDGEELRILVCDPARPESHVAIGLDRNGGWRSAAQVPDSYRLLVALASPAGVRAVPELTEEARLTQTTVTKKLREQARCAVEGFVQEVLDHPPNREALARFTDRDALAKRLWSEGLVLVYRLLFVLKLESSPDPARAFSFAATSIWRNTYSPNVALARLVRKSLDEGAVTGGLLESGLRTLFRLFSEGLHSSELRVSALGGMLFGTNATPQLDALAWGERAVARLLDNLLWTPSEGKLAPQRVHYGALDVEDLGRVYEALLELEPSITSAPMSRLRRGKLEVVVPAAQAAPYRVKANGDAEDDGEEDEGDDADDSGAKRDSKTQVRWIDDIAADRFFLRVGLGRKASGSYYTPHPFVRFLVQETLGPQVAERSPAGDPNPAAILALKVLDPAMGSGHFLVEACRFLGDKLYEACRLCDERALDAEEKAEKATTPDEKAALLARAADLRARVERLPDPNDELVAYLPSRATEGEESGLSQRKAEALARRLVAVHCLYGVDKNPLAVELAKLSLWLESYAEGLPLTFLDHRLVCGDSLTGPFVEQLLEWPGSGKPIDDLFVKGVRERLGETLAAALAHVRDIESSVGKDIADIEQKRLAKERLDAALAPFKTLAAAWTGGVMLGDEADDAAYEALLRAVASGVDVAALVASNETLRRMVELGRPGIAYDLAFPEVFHRDGGATRSGGFDAVLGNPPWESIRPIEKEFFARYDLAVLDQRGRPLQLTKGRLLENPATRQEYTFFVGVVERLKRAADRLYTLQKVVIEGDLAGRWLDAFRLFFERAYELASDSALVGQLLPDAFHTNAGGVGVRRRWSAGTPKYCISFRNSRLLFELASGERFDLVVGATSASASPPLLVAFGLEEPAVLFNRATSPFLPLSREFLARFGGPYQTIPQIETQRQLEILDAFAANSIAYSTAVESIGLHLQTNPAAINMGIDSGALRATSSVLDSGDPRMSDHLTILLARGLTYLHEKGTFNRFTDLAQDKPRSCVMISELRGAPSIAEQIRYYRLVGRKVIHASEESKAVFTVVTPGGVVSDSAMVEGSPAARPNSAMLTACAELNSLPFDYLAHFQVSLNLSLFILRNLLLPGRSIPRRSNYLSRAALRLVCNHEGYADLWREQLGDEWREPTPRHTWPVLAGDDARWAVRAAIDTVVAQAYGLDRAQYEHVLASFSHKSYPKAPDLCLRAFDELTSIGLDAFVQKHDPYADIPLVEALPKPVIDLPTIEPEPASAEAKPRTGQLELIATPSVAARPKRERARRAKTAAVAEVPYPYADEIYAKIVRLLEDRVTITSADAQAATNLDAAAVRPHLQRLITEGKATTEGERRGTKYRLRRPTQ
ncbi:MAG: hypothetical protein HY292_18150 [Planctomycetes bacterium]|nr:hypothetical protein [Planctomycetota bacterium]